jgi:SagB-type dehydrogenase family enzyme
VKRTFRRSPHVVCFWDRDDLILYNYATGTELVASAELCTIVDACDVPRTAAAILPRCPTIEPRHLRGLIALLVEFKMLYAGARLPAAERTTASLGAWNPEVGFFHKRTRNVPFSDRLEGSRHQRAQARRNPMPPPVKRVSATKTVPLPLAAPTTEFPRVLLERRTWRRFGRQRVPLVDLAQLLRYTAGIHFWVPARGLGRSALRTSPSGGARHSIELYVIAKRVQGLAVGTYHYSSDRHVLERVRKGTLAGGAERHMPEQPWYDDAAAVVFFTVLFPRVRWRYDYSRAYRAVLIEAGHLCQTFCLTATWLGLAPFCTMALDDDGIERDLKIDGVSESVLYAAGVGARRAGVGSAIAPAGVREPVLIPNPAFA